MLAAELAPELRVQQPYPGLRAFEPEEAFLFYGRETHTAELLRRLAENRFLAVVGNSGSGKSSLVRAGLLPSLYRGRLVGATSQWRICVMRPGSTPLDNLAESLVERKVFSDDKETVRQELGRSSLGLVRVVRASRFAEGESLLLVVDQFEELFRFVRERKEEDHGAEAQLFVASLLEAADRSTAPVYVVLTMRSDYIGDCTQFTGLPEVLNRSQYLIPRLNREQIRDAIEKPVRLSGAQISQLLAETLLNELGNEMSELPVLQHALNRTFLKWKEGGADGEVSIDPHFVAAGGLLGALDVHANELLKSVDANWAERLFRCLTTVEGGRKVRRPTRLGRIYDVVGAADDESRNFVLDVIKTYSRREDSLLVWSGKELTEDSVVDLSHESLIVLWRKLEQWVDAEARAAEWYESVSKDAIRDKSGEAGKWRDRQLSVALGFLEQGYWTEAWAERLTASGTEFSEVKAFLERNADEQRMERHSEEARRANQLRTERKAKEAAQARVRWLVVSMLILLLGGVAVIWLTYVVSRHRARENKLAVQLHAKDEDTKRLLAEQTAIADRELELLNAAVKKAEEEGNVAGAAALQAKADAVRSRSEASTAAAASQDARRSLSDALDRAARTEKELNQLKSEYASLKGQRDRQSDVQDALNRASRAENERSQLQSQLDTAQKQLKEAQDALKALGVGTILQSMKRTAENFQTAQSEFVWDDYTKAVDDHDLQKGTVYFRRVNGVKEVVVDINSPDRKYVRASNGIISTYQPKLNTITVLGGGKSPFATFASDMQLLLMLGFGLGGEELQRSFDVKYDGFEYVQGVLTLKLVLTSKLHHKYPDFYFEPEFPESITYWLDPVRGISVQQLFGKSSGDYTIRKFSNIRINSKIPSDVFQFPTNSHTKVVTP